MLYRVLADLVVFFHFLFIIFVLVGGIGALWTRRFFWVHLPALMWGALIEFWGWICPLTHLENLFLAKGGLYPYHSGFIEHYIIPVVYPSFLTRKIQFLFGMGVLAVNTLIYWKVFKYYLKKEN